jgi:transposase InsO family protein
VFSLADRFVFTVHETRATDRSVSFGFPRPSGRELPVNCQNEWLRSWTGHSGGATSRFTRFSGVLRVEPTPRPCACYYDIYVNLDIYSHYAVGWMLATRDESAVLAEKLIADIAAKQGTSGSQLTLHADRGSSMTSKAVAFLPPTSGSPSPTRVRTCPTTIRSERRSSRP